MIEDFREERQPRSARPRARDRQIVLGPFSPAVRAIAACSNLASLIRRDYARTIGIHRGSHPRTQSVVNRRLDRPATEVLSRLSEGDLQVRAGATILAGNPTAITYDPVDHEYRVPCTLTIPLSWPRLPMWLAVGELSSTRSALRLSLRSRRRLRYPARYYHVAHTVLSRLALRLT